MTGKITLCQYARVTGNGKQYDAIGAGIHSIDVPKFPASLTLSILIELHLTSAEAGREHPFELRIMDEDGKSAGPTLNGSIRAEGAVKGSSYTSFGLQFGVTKETTLIYALLMNGEEKDNTKLSIGQAKPTPNQQGKQS
jgi:hypothetical protein